MEELISTIQELNQASYIDCIQVITSVVGVIISGFALFYAISIPKKIANEQNKIALLEKRTQIYLDFSEIIRSNISLPITIRNTRDIKINKKFDIWSRELESKFAVAGFVFSPDLKADIEHLRELYSYIKFYDILVEDGLKNINNSEDKNHVLKLFLKYFMEEISDDELEELKGLCQRYKFTYEAYSEDDVRENVLTDLYELTSQQCAIEKEAQELGIVVLGKMQKEIQFHIT